MPCTGLGAQHALEALVHDLDHRFLLSVTGVDLQANDERQRPAEPMIKCSPIAARVAYVVTNA